MVSKCPVRFPTILTVVIAALICATKPTLAAAQATDFGFRLEVGDCLTERFDTFSGVFTKDLGKETVTAAFALTDAQMGTIYHTIERIRFFDYPSLFSGVPAGVKEIMSISPHTTYHLEVRNAGMLHTVSWKDSSKPVTPEADRLRDLFSMIIGFIHEHPAVTGLPRSTMGCE
jgi:hypothetical protein